MRSRRGTIQFFLLMVIIGTIPLYLIGIGLLLLSPDRNAAGGTRVPPTWTPLNDGNSQPMITAEGTVTLPVFASATANVPPSFTPIFGETFIPVTSSFPTQAPTYYASPTPFVPSSTPPPTVTQPSPPTQEQPTSAPPPTQPPLLPPTNTPNSP